MIDTRLLRCQAKEVVVELDRAPHLLSRIEISGSWFPHRAVPPFVRIRASDEKTTKAWLSSVSDDNRKLFGYFQEELPDRGTIEFGYGSEVMGCLAQQFEAKSIVRLDRQRLPPELVVVNRAFLEKKLRLKS